jgi:heme A synthase
MLTVELLLSILTWHKESNEQYVSKMFWIMLIIYPLALAIGIATAL